MSETKGCLGWIGGTIGWFVVWGLCMSIGDNYKISPFLVLLILVAITVACVVLFFYLRISADKKNKERENEIKKKYPRAYSKYAAKFQRYADADDKAKEIAARSDATWEKEEKALEQQEIRQREMFRKNREIAAAYPNGFKRWKELYPRKRIEEAIASEDEIKQLETLFQESEKYNNWEKEQAQFTQRCYNLSKELLANFGRYVYQIPFEKKNPDGQNVSGVYKVWQHFPEELCLDKDLDYSLFPNIKQNLANVPQFKAETRYFNKPVYEKIINFVNELMKDEDVLVYINGDVPGWNVGNLYYHYKNLFPAFDCKKMYAPVLLETLGLQDTDWRAMLKRRVVVIDMMTENPHLIDVCKNIIDKARDKRPLITYISLLKCFTREEATRLIDKRQKEVAEKERKRKEAEEREKQQQEELRTKRMMLGAAESKDWPMVKGVHHYFFFYYYPTRFDDVTEFDWDVRNLIWDFKDGTRHDKVCQILTEKLRRVYGKALDLLTFVCIPASTREVNRNRYQEFMTDVCNATGMANGYDYVTIVKEKEPSHLGGESSAEYSYDKDFFKGRQIILFDDVVTRGRSLAKMRMELENVGAHIVAALSIGRTYSDYYGDIREPHPWVVENQGN